MDRAPIGSERRPLRVAIIGTGPAGFYAAQTLTRARELSVRIDLIDRLPTPFGLVRAGIAPDHASIKRVSRSFTRVAGDPRLRFFGNVRVGGDVSIAELRERYDAVVIATGAQSSRRMGIPGEDLEGVSSATAFVFWYNGHPDYTALRFRLDEVSRAIIVGNGNVALDAARVLSLSQAALRETDIADHALEALGRRRVQDVHVLGRRGPAQAAFTAPEIRELGRRPSLSPRVDPAALELDAATLALHDQGGLPTRTDKILRELSTLATDPVTEGRALHLRFLVGVQAFLGDDEGRLRAVRLIRNRLVEEDGRLLALPTGEPWEEPCQLALTAVGYRGVPIPGLPFDDARGIVPNEGGRVHSSTGHQFLPGLYVTGWARRGPSGVVGTNKPDAKAVASALLDDLAGQVAACAPPEDLSVLLASRQVRVVDWAAWERIDAQERAAGEAQGRPRVKQADWPALLALAGV
jgi:ferredoxin/flavodoxin---NADP+ reductase